MPDDRKVAVVTGGNKGLGLETCRQLATRGYRVFLCARDAGKGTEAAAALAAKGLSVEPVVLDVTSDDSVAKAAATIAKSAGRVDALVNCAGIFLDWGGESSLQAANFEKIRASLETNTYGALRTLKAFATLMEKAAEPRVVNVSSGMGQLSEMNGGSVGYRLSKTALNALTRIAHDEWHARGACVNSVCPGWVKTDMGGASATRNVDEGAAGIVWAATLPKGGPSGGFFRDGKAIAW
jgi:NAD(P)-dependent dehydrogenase (short-subunit alcohol dehydrogenase family)